MTTFEILGVNPSDSQEVIKKNYRKLTLKYHPDRNQGSVYAEKKFKEITKAYSKIINSNFSIYHELCSQIYNELEEAINKCKTISVKEKFHIARQFRFSISIEVKKIKENLLLSNSDFKEIETALVHSSSWIRNIAIEIANNEKQYMKAIELLGYSINLLSYGENYTLDKELNDQIFEDYKILHDNYSGRFHDHSIIMLASRLLYRWGANKIKQNNICGCGSQLELKNCCGCKIW